MTEFPHGPRRAPAPDGLERALAAGRTRLRRRRVTGSAATVSAAAVVAAALAGHAAPRSSDRLVPADTPTATPRASARADAPPPPLPTLPPSPGSLPTSLPTPGETPPPPPPDSPSPSEATSPAPAAPRRWVGTGPRNADGTPVVRVTTANDPAACASPDYRDAVALTGFCTFASGPTTLRAGDTAEYAFTLCRAARTDKALSYRTAFETSFVAYDAGHERPEVDWEWGDAAAFPASPHTLTFRGGDCRTWTVEWSGQDSAGWAVADGTYEVLGNAVPVEWSGDGEVPAPPASVLVTVSS